MLVIDADYSYNKINEPVPRIFGKMVEGDDEGKDIILHVLGMEPYFYIDNSGVDVFELQKTVDRVLKGYVKRVEITMKYKPVGYQKDKSPMLKIVLFNPKTVPEVREILKKNIPKITNSSLYEADIPYSNRCMVDLDMNGMDVIEVNAEKIPNYGLGINNDNIYVCRMEDIKVLKDEVVKIEY